MSVLAPVHAELGGMFPVSGETARFPHFAFGSRVGPCPRIPSESEYEMAASKPRTVIVLAACGFLLAGLGYASPSSASPGSSDSTGTDGCSAGARTLAQPGSHLYPEVGNGGYTSVHTLVHMVYDADTNTFLTGNQVVLTQRATQCLTNFSLDFERRSNNAAEGPNMAVQSVTVNGRAARFRFAQPAYPGDANGPDDPNPAAREASQTNPAGGPDHNPLPPACTPQLLSDKASARHSLNGTQCPANKLVITPAQPIRDRANFEVKVNYTGRPGVHNDGDGGREGWWRTPNGGFVITEPIGTQAWMPLNNYPTAKPTYDFSDTVTAGRTVVANGVLGSVRHNRPDNQFPGGSVTWNWRSTAPIASYLVENSVGKFHLTERTADNGTRYYVGQDASISAERQKENLAIMNEHQDITEYESLFTGAYPFASNGVFVGTPKVGDQMEMQTMIVFDNSRIDTSTFYHENMHQWWGDNVGESSIEMTFFKEGMAVVSEMLFAARKAEAKAGGPQSKKGQAAFQASLVKQFDRIYRSKGKFWTVAPSNPDAFNLFDDSNTYNRPGAAYIALRQILGSTNFTQALQQIQRAYGGGTITEPQLEAAFAHWLPVQTGTCRARLSQFFRQWFDTAYPAGGGKDRPQLTGPGLTGPGFYSAGGGCA
ncbi:MAG: hypothetical protein DLM59_01980 [Pseudonocardiales bacterium]|nr:MAG: hypothetical protein DLM59_01980 [Pseudonocardiales bacterium]